MNKQERRGGKRVQVAYGDNPMSETIIVRRTGQAPLRVRGVIIASVSSSWDTASTAYSGSTGQKQDVCIIRTSTGKYVVRVEHYTLWLGSKDTHDAAVYPSLKQCVEYLSDRIPGWMLKELIEELGEEAVAEEVE